MEFLKTSVQGAYLIKPQFIKDERGYFARIWCRNELKAHNLKAGIVNSNAAFNPLRGTLRGLHYQKPPHQEVKIVRCCRGAIFDVIVDLRHDSPTFKKWFGCELTEGNSNMLYVPEGCATGYLTLSDNTEMYYHTTEFFYPKSASGVRYNDTSFNIQWPGEISSISDADKNRPDFKG